MSYYDDDEPIGSFALIVISLMVILVVGSILLMIADAVFGPEEVTNFIANIIFAL